MLKHCSRNNERGEVIEEYLSVRFLPISSIIVLGFTQIFFGINSLGPNICAWPRDGKPVGV